MKIGDFNRLKVSRLVDFGAYLTEDTPSSAEILLPSRYITEALSEGQEVEVFVYRDSLDRPVAVTTPPLAKVGEVAFLEVKMVTKVGAFLDWGLPKDLLVPFSEQKSKMREGGIYPVYVYLDNVTGRVAATAKIEKYIDNVPPSLHAGTRVEALVWKPTELGWACIVENKHSGMIYSGGLFKELRPGDKVKAIVSKVRDDGRLDLILGGSALDRSTDVADRIMNYLVSHDRLPVGDKSSPEEINMHFHCSKKDFKKAVGHLLKGNKISIDANGAIVSALK